MKTFGVWIILAVIVAAVVLGLWPRKEHTAAPSQETGMQEIKIASSAFENNGSIPAKYTCDREDVSPPLEVSGVPAGTKSLALIMHDPDAPRAGGWTHWVKWNIKPMTMTMTITEGEEPDGTSGKGTGGSTTYMGPCPPSGTHRYFFTVYALDTELTLKEGATKTEVEQAMEGHVIGKGELVGLYSRE